MALVLEPGLMPSCDFSTPGSTSGYVAKLEPGVMWGSTEDEVKERLGQQQAETVNLVATPAQSVGIVTLEQRIDIQRSVGDPIVLNNKGGIDLKNIQDTALDLTVRIAHPISAFGVKSMRDIVAEGFINPILYRVLRKEFDELFDKIKNILAALDGIKTLPENIVKTMRQGLYLSASALVLQFLQQHAELIEFTQLATVTDGDFATRALGAIMEGRPIKDLPANFKYLVESHRRR